MKYLVSTGEFKEEVARRIAARDKVEEGLVCVLSCVATCRTFDVYRNREKRKLRDRECCELQYIHRVLSRSLRHRRTVPTAELA